MGFLVTFFLQHIGFFYFLKCVVIIFLPCWIYENFFRCCALEGHHMKNFDRVRIVLVNTSHPGNIGAAARALKNMGLYRLYLVEPKDYPADQAVWRAANALDVVNNAGVVDDLDTALSGCGWW